MELIGSLFLTLAVALLVGLFLSQPLIRGRRSGGFGLSDQQLKKDHELSALLAERDRVLNALHELDFDYAMGKVPPEDYPPQRAALLQNGADLLRRLDQINLPDGSGLETVEERIEAAVAARRADSRPVLAGMPALAGNGGGQKDELEEIIASRKRQRKESSAGFCPGCGRPVQKSDRFCSKCGAVL